MKLYVRIKEYWFDQKVIFPTMDRHRAFTVKDDEKSDGEYELQVHVYEGEELLTIHAWVEEIGGWEVRWQNNPTT